MILQYLKTDKNIILKNNKLENMSLAQFYCQSVLLNLCKRLVSQNHEVVCLDNLYTGKKENIENLLKEDNFEFVEADIINEIPLENDFDWIFNLACPASPLHYQWDPVQTTKTSVHGAINMLGLAKRLKAKIFQASTSETGGRFGWTISGRCQIATSPCFPSPASEVWR